MIKNKRRIAFCMTVIILNIAFIWANSLLPREMSSALSKFVGKILSIFFPGPFTPAEGTGQGILRKIAHFLEFCSLGFFLGWFTRMVREKKWQCVLYPVIAGITVAAVDETIQIFVPGRGPMLRDVGIDSLGVLLGVGLISLIAWLVSRKKQSGIS